jgi:hypothetical protein
MTASSRSAEIRTQLSLPVIDTDGHWLEPVPIFLDFLETEGGSAMVGRFRENKEREDVWHGLSTEERLS